MSIQQAIAKLDGSSEALERMACRMDTAARWLQAGEPDDRPLDDLPPDIAVGDLESHEPSILAYKAVMAASEYSHELRASFEELRAKYLSWKNDARTGRMVSSSIQRDANKLRAQATFTRFAAATLRSLAAQHAQRPTSGGLVQVPAAYWVGVLQQSLREADRWGIREESPDRDWCRRTDEAITELFGVDCRPARELTARLHAFVPPEKPWMHSAERPDWGAVCVLLRGVIAQAEAGIASAQQTGSASQGETEFGGGHGDGGR